MRWILLTVVFTLTLALPIRVVAQQELRFQVSEKVFTADLFVAITFTDQQAARLIPWARDLRSNLRRVLPRDVLTRWERYRQENPSPASEYAFVAHGGKSTRLPSAKELLDEFASLAHTHDLWVKTANSVHEETLAKVQRSTVQAMEKARATLGLRSMLPGPVTLSPSLMQERDYSYRFLDGGNSIIAFGPGGLYSWRIKPWEEWGGFWVWLHYTQSPLLEQFKEAIVPKCDFAAKIPFGSYVYGVLRTRKDACAWAYHEILLEVVTWRAVLSLDEQWVKHLGALHRQGFVLAPFFGEQLQRCERERVAFADCYPRMIEALDPSTIKRP